jgi:hypothetical protein
MELDTRKLSKEEISMVTSIALNNPQVNEILKDSRYEIEGCWASLKYEGSNLTKISIVAYSDIDKANTSNTKKLKGTIYPCINIYITYPVKSKVTVIVDLFEKKVIKVVGIPLKP